MEKRKELTEEEASAEDELFLTIRGTDGQPVNEDDTYQKQVQGILTVGEEGEIVIEPKMREWLESIECTAEGDA